MRRSACLSAAALCLTVVAVGCGSDSKSEGAEEQATPTEAIEHIDNVRAGLDIALAKYQGGDKKAANDIVGDAYLKEFEEVEGPLGKVDNELNETLEDGIREELRDKIKAGAPASEIEAMVSEIKTNLNKAEAALR